MPLPLQRRSPRRLAILPISLTTALSLIATLSYLQLLYAASYLLRPIRGSRHNSRPLRDTIEPIEKRTVEIILRIVPVSAYRSPPTSCLIHEDPLGHRIVSAARSPQPGSQGHYTQGHYAHVSSDTAAPHGLFQCYPSNAVERVAPDVSYIPVSVSPEHVHRHENARSKSSIYETVKTSSPKTRPHISAIMDQHQTATQQVTRTGSSTRCQQGEENQLAETADTQSSAPVPDMPDTTYPHDKSPAVSLDAPSECGMHSISTESNDSFSVPLSRSTKHRSTESYPGRFPVSDGLEHSDLATAPYAFRERGTTFVRPFSDY